MVGRGGWESGVLLRWFGACLLVLGTGGFLGVSAACLLGMHAVGFWDVLFFMDMMVGGWGWGGESLCEYGPEGITWTPLCIAVGAFVMFSVGGVI